MLLAELFEKEKGSSVILTLTLIPAIEQAIFVQPVGLGILPSIPTRLSVVLGDLVGKLCDLPGSETAISLAKSGKTVLYGTLCPVSNLPVPVQPEMCEKRLTTLKDMSANPLPSNREVTECSV